MRASQGRRRLLGMLLAGVAVPVCGGEAGPVRPPSRPAALTALVNAAIKAEVSGDLAAAERHIAQAKAYIDARPDERWALRFYVLPVNAYIALRQDRPALALDLMQEALQAYDRALARWPEQIGDGLLYMDRALGRVLVRAEYNRQIVTMIQSVHRTSTIDNLADDVSWGALDTIWMMLARAMQAAGDAAGLARLYRERIAPIAIDDRDLYRLMSHEHRLYKVGAFLSLAGCHEEARDAWRLARHANARRIHDMMRNKVQQQVQGAAAMRRRLLAASIFAAQRSGRLAAEAPALVADLAATKSAGARFGEAVRASLRKDAPDLVDAMNGLEDRLAALPVNTPDPGPFWYLMQEHDALWATIGERTSLHTSSFRQAEASETAALQARLGSAVAIGFMLLTPPRMAGQAAQVPQYLRYCLGATTLQLQLVGTQGTIDRLVHACRTGFLDGVKTPPAAAQLAALLLGELPPAAEAAADWILDPDGALHLLPFDALPDASGRPLLHTRTIRLATSLHALDTTLHAVAPGPAAVFADPDYGTAPSTAAAATPSLRWSGTIAPGRVTPLPETRREAHAVAASLAQLGMRSRLYLQRDASATGLTALRSPVVLHIAAHAVLRMAIDNGMPQVGQDAGDLMELLLPGRQAGLLLSHGGQPAVMLAKDVERLDLQGTALVVLSACDTANGEIVPGESIASLRRAVELAGARSAVTALWQVPSAATALLMADFYGALAGGATTAGALRQAKLAALARGAPPHAWAGFQLSGQDLAFGPQPGQDSNALSATTTTASTPPP